MEEKEDRMEKEKNRERRSSTKRRGEEGREKRPTRGCFKTPKFYSKTSMKSEYMSTSI